jgi:small subunit ribosomal protein S2
MARVTYNELLEAGAHYGHLKRKWNPKMAPYIFMERNGIHIIDLHKTVAKLDEAAAALKQIAKSGKRILFCSTKKQAKEVVAEKAKLIGMPYVIERWPGGMLTNFTTIRKTVKKMANIDKMISDGTFETISKKERLTISRERAKLEKDFGSVSDLNKLPSAVFIVDIVKEHLALTEAKKLRIPTFGIIDTNADPNLVDFPIPANDDSAKSIGLILDVINAAIKEGLEERREEKEMQSKDNVEAKEGSSEVEAPVQEAKIEEEPKA